MKRIAILLTATLMLVPGIAAAEYICDKRFAEKYGKTCPAGSAWDNAYHACIAVGS